MSDKDMSEIAALVEQIGALLHGRRSGIQGAVLAELLAYWLAGHHREGDPDATRKFRAVLLSGHLQAVRSLVPINAKILGTTE